MTTKIIGFHQAQKTKENNFKILRDANSLEFFCPDDQGLDEDIVQFLETNKIDYTCIINKDWKTFHLFVSVNNFLIQKPYFHPAFHQSCLTSRATKPEASRTS